jgi:nicotinamidase-related amidase
MPTSRRALRRSRTALLLVDFINPLDFPGAEKLRAGALRAAARARLLKRKARATRVPCIYVNDHFGDWTTPFAEQVSGVIRSGGPGGRIAELLEPEKGDIAILKPRHSGFYGTPLEFLLDELGASRLIVTGLATDNCVFATAQDAHVRKYKVWIPADCVAAEDGTGERTVLRHMARTLKAETKRYAGRLWP